MAVPWLRLIDLFIGVTNFAQSRAARSARRPDDEQLVAGSRALGHIETRLAGVVVAALREAFDRDSKRLDLERDHLEAERQRAERALRLELARQSGDREIGRLRLVAGSAIVGWLGTLVLAGDVMHGAAVARLALGGGWALLLAALAASFLAQAAIGDALARIDETSFRRETLSSGITGAVAPWLVVSGLALIGLAVLIA